MKVVSLFSGCGGTDLGFMLAGHKIIYSNDIDKIACETYKKNFPHVKNECANIRKIKSFPKGDILVGCYPCQGFSIAGKRDPSDERNMLYLEFARALKKIKPKFFVAENVKGLVSITNSKIFKNMLKRYRSCGYRVKFLLMNAKNYGVPQDRERVFIVGVRKDIDFEFNFPEKNNKKNVNLKMALSGLPRVKKEEYNRSKFSYIYMSRNRKRNWDEVSFTIQAGAQHAPLHPNSNKMVQKEQNVFVFKRGKFYRRMSYRECARIQSFPNSFYFSGSIMEKYKQIGNAVPPLLAYHISKQIPLRLNKKTATFSGKNYSFGKLIKKIYL